MGFHSLDTPRRMKDLWLTALLTSIDLTNQYPHVSKENPHEQYLDEFC